MAKRQATVSLYYNDVDITEDMKPYLLGFSYTDNETGKTDDMSIQFRNDVGLFNGDWFPSKGDVLGAEIVDQDNNLFLVSDFLIDELTMSGPPSVFTIKGVSVPLYGGRREAKTKSWEEVTLSEIAQEVADESGLSLYYETSINPLFDRIDQREESSLQFLGRICEQEGVNLKVNDLLLAVYGQRESESKDAILTVSMDDGRLLSYEFSSQAFDLYSECTVNYYDPDSEDYITYTYTDSSIPNGMKAKITRRASSFAEAERWAKAELRRRNRNEVTGQIKITGHRYLFASAVILISGFGVYDGRYIIETAKHTVDDSGWLASCSIRRVLESY